VEAGRLRKDHPQTEMELDPIIHQPTRLKLMASLVALSNDEVFDFPALARFHKLTDGNLGAHLEKLERAGYIEIRKLFQGKKPRTEVLTTVKGRSAFADHTAALRKIIGELG
jgi:DNA-binding MarR family transcriptional regulator